MTERQRDTQRERDGEREREKDIEVGERVRERERERLRETETGRIWKSVSLKKVCANILRRKIKEFVFKPSQAKAFFTNSQILPFSLKTVPILKFKLSI